MACRCVNLLTCRKLQLLSKSIPGESLVSNINCQVTSRYAYLSDDTQQRKIALPMIQVLSFILSHQEVDKNNFVGLAQIFFSLNIDLQIIWCRCVAPLIICSNYPIELNYPALDSKLLLIINLEILDLKIEKFPCLVHKL